MGRTFIVLQNYGVVVPVAYYTKPLNKYLNGKIGTSMHSELMVHWRVQHIYVVSVTCGLRGGGDPGLPL